MTIKPLIEGGVFFGREFMDKHGFEETMRVFSADVSREVEKNVDLLRMAHDQGIVPEDAGLTFKISIAWDRVSVIRMDGKTPVAFELAVREATKTLLAERRASLGMRMSYDTAAIVDALIAPVQITSPNCGALPLVERVRFRFGSFDIYPSHHFPERTIRIFTIDEDPIWIDVVNLPSIGELDAVGAFR